MNEAYIPHQNLEDPSNIIEDSKRQANILFNEVNNEYIDINHQEIDKQNNYINNLENNLEYDSKYQLDKKLYNINYNDKQNLNLSENQKINITENQLINAKEQIKYLTKENISLKNIISNKDKIISDFEELSLQFKEKFDKLEKINMNLRKQLQSKYLGAENENIINITDKIFNNKLTNDNNIDIKDKEFKTMNNNNLKLNNEDLIYSLNNIKKELEIIENEYKMKLNEKECYIEKLNCEILNIYKEYVKLSDILEEMNYLIKNSDYNELKTEFNCLLREKELLLKEKEKNHMEIISLREKFMKNPYDCRNLGKNEGNKNEELLNIFKEKEKNYIYQISDLEKKLVEKIKENDELKSRQESILREYELKI
jgi:hypothetical protein